MNTIAISDIDVLRNAVRFSTAQRAFTAKMVIEKARSCTIQAETAYLCIEGLSHFVIAPCPLLQP